MSEITIEERTAADEMVKDIEKWIDKEIPALTIMSVLLQGAALVARNNQLDMKHFASMAAIQFGYVFNSETPPEIDIKGPLLS